MRDHYLYPDVNVLVNKFGIKDETKLEAIERDITSKKLMMLDSLSGGFDYNHLKEVHKHIFGDIFDWAGQERDIPVFKGEDVLGGMSVNYAFPSEISKNAKKAINNLHKANWDNLSLDKKAENLALITADLWKAHPFREGNTRTTMAFITAFAEEKGFPMDKQLLAENSGYLRKALVLASIPPYSEPQHLTKVFKDSIERGLEKTIKAEKKPSILAKLETTKKEASQSAPKQSRKKSLDINL